MSRFILKKTLSCAVLAALSTCALAGCGKQTAADSTASADADLQTQTVDVSQEATSESTVETTPEATSAPDAAAASKSQETPTPEFTICRSDTPYGVHGALHVENGKLTDRNGEVIQLYGMSTHGIAWFPQYINPDAFRTLRDDWNTNCIRLAMYTAEYGGYCAGGDQAQLKQLVKDGVSYATDLGMYVIVDWHILSDGDPNQHKDEAIAFFREMTAAFADNDNVLYEICNEPNGGTSWDSIKSYAEEVIPVIREQKPDAVILVGTPTWSQEIDKAAASPLSYDNIMYTLHFYAGTHKDDLRNRLETCEQNNLPVFVSEFGMCDASGNGANDFDSTLEWFDLLNKYQISFCCWNLANKDESSSVFKASSTAVSDWTDDDFNESGRWIRDYFRTMTQK